jgi:hypothetical protein
LSVVSMQGDGWNCELATTTCASSVPLAAGMNSKPIILTATIGKTLGRSVKNVAYVTPSANDIPETNVLVVPGMGSDTSSSATDNDGEATIQVLTTVKLPVTR